MTLPNFFIVGAAKAGTTALYDLLRQHPEIGMSRWKEPKYFAFSSPDELTFRAPEGDAPVNRTTVLDREVYEDLWSEVADRPARGEASAIYLYVEDAPRRIREAVPGARIIVILRNPVERAFSSWQHLVRDGLEPLGFAEGLDAEPQRIEENYGFLWRYTDLGFYTSQLARYRSLFPPEQMLVLLHDDLRSDPAGTLRQVVTFLGVDDDFEPSHHREANRSGAPRSRWLHGLMNPSAGTARRLWDRTPAVLREPLMTLRTRVTNANLERLPFEAEDRRRLEAVFADEVAALEQVLGRSLGHWIGSSPTGRSLKP